MTVTSSVQRDDAAAIRVLEAVAAARDIDIETLNPPLGTVIDPDALEAILDADSDSDVAVSFTYADCRISVTSDDIDVRVHPDAAD